MAEDFELAAAITVEDESELQDLTADVGADGDGGGQAGIVGAGGGGDGDGKLGKRLTGILSVVTKILTLIGGITLIPGLLNGVIRLLEVALLPIGVLFQNLLAPLIQRLLRFFATTNLFDKIGTFADIIVDTVQSLIEDIQPLINEISNFVGQSFETGIEASEGEQEVAETVVSGVSPAIPAPFNVATFNREFTAQAFDTLATDQTNQTNKEDAN
jgi:hypothetical protein